MDRYPSIMTPEPTDPPPPGGGPPPEDHHVATVSHDGRFWDVYLEFDDDPRHPETRRAALLFSPADRTEDEGVLRTIPLIIEPTYEQVLARARGLEDHELVGFLRSLLP